MKQYNKPTLFGVGLVETIPLPRLGFLRGVFLANHLACPDNLTSNNQEAYKLMLTQKCP